MRLIDADYVLRALSRYNKNKPNKETVLDDIQVARRIVENAPTVDVNGIGECLCKDCIYFYDVGNDGWGRCHENGGRWQRDDYCSWGKTDGKNLK